MNRSTAKLPNKRSSPTSFWYQVGKETRSFWRKLGKKYLAIKWWNNSRTLHMIWQSGWRRCGLEWGRRSQIAHTWRRRARWHHARTTDFYENITRTGWHSHTTPHTGPHRGTAHTVDKPLANMVADRPCQATPPKIPGSDNKGSGLLLARLALISGSRACQNRPGALDRHRATHGTPEPGTTEEENVALTTPYGADQEIGVSGAKRRQWKLVWTFSKGEVQVGHAKRAVWLMAMQSSWLHTREFGWMWHRSY